MHKGNRTLTVIFLIAICFSLLLCPEVAVSQTTDSYHPATYAPAGATQYVSGTPDDLRADDGVRMAFHSYPSQFSPISLYAHQEMITLAGADYYVSSFDISDKTGTNLSTPLSSAGRSLLGEFICPLTGTKSIPSSTWTFYYRAWLSSLPQYNIVNSPSWVPMALWGNAQYAYSSDNAYANSSVPGARQQYGNYGVNLPLAAEIVKVEVGYEAYAIGNELLGLSLSWNGGLQWTADYVSPSLGSSDSDIVNWVDFTTAANWTVSMLSNSNFLSRVGVVNSHGGRTEAVLLDWLPVRVTYVDAPLSAHLDANVLVLKSDGTVRQMLAPGVANSGLLTPTMQTLTGTYNWPEYAVVDQTDYLEIAYYVDIADPRLGVNAYLRIDDVTSVVEDQTRVAGFMVPIEYTAEVEFSGYSNTNDWSQVLWTIDSSWTTDGVSVTQQLYDYAQGTYPAAGNGYANYLSSSIPDTDVTKNQTVATNATNFRDSSGNWKMRIRGTKSIMVPFGLNVDSSTFQTTTILIHDIAILDVTCHVLNMHAGETASINVTVRNKGGTAESFYVTVFSNETQIARDTVTNLAPNQSRFLSFIWNTTGMTPGAYVLKAVADAVENENNIVDNTFVYGGSVNLLPPSSRAPLNWMWALLGIPPLILVFAIGLKKRKSKPKTIGIEYFDKITEGGIPEGFSVMLVGGSDSAKGILFQELAAHMFSKMERLWPCIYVTYECFPDEIRESLNKFHWDTAAYEKQGKFLFIDCFSSSAKLQSKETYYLAQPFSLVDLGISISKSTSDMGEGVRLFLDSINPLLAQLDPARVIDFLQDRIARIKGVNGNLVFTSNKESLDPTVMSRLEEIVDCVVELDTIDVEGEIVRRLRIKKMRGRNPSDGWVQFTVDAEKGTSFMI